MHLPDHYLDPTTCAATAIISGAAIAYGVRQLKHESNGRLQMLGAVSAAIFAAQMVNFPIAAGTSGHLIGGTLAAVLLGPWAGLLSIALVLSVQALIFGDGGIAALGANIFNMGVIGAVGGGYVYQQCRALFAKMNDSMGVPLSAAVAGWTTVVVAALAGSLQMAIAGKFLLAEVLSGMLGIHVLIGLSEGLLTAGAVGLIYQLVPGLLADARSNGVATDHEQDRELSRESSAGRARWTLLAIAVGISVLISPLASSAPDGLESIVDPLAANVEPQSLLPIESMLSDYEMPGVGSPLPATALAGLLGTLIVVSLATFMQRTATRSVSRAAK